jgi:hypothetical protein
MKKTYIYLVVALLITGVAVAYYKKPEWFKIA